MSNADDAARYLRRAGLDASVEHVAQGQAVLFIKGGVMSEEHREGVRKILMRDECTPIASVLTKVGRLAKDSVVLAARAALEDGRRATRIEAQPFRIRELTEELEDRAARLYTNMTGEEERRKKQIEGMKITSLFGIKLIEDPTVPEDMALLVDDEGRVVAMVRGIEVDL